MVRPLNALLVCIKEAHKKTKEAEEKIIARSAKRISKVSWAVIKEIGRAHV